MPENELTNLHPINFLCPCGKPATFSTILHLDINGNIIKTHIPVCAIHVKVNPKLIKIQKYILPTHCLINISIVEQYPPKQSEIFRTPEGGLVIGCPKCSHPSALDTTIFRLTTERLEPSFICPFCKLHAWLQLIQPNA